MYITINDDLETEQDLPDAVHFLHEENNSNVSEPEKDSTNADAEPKIRNNQGAISSVNDLIHFTAESNRLEVLQLELIYKARNVLKVASIKVTN